MKTKTVLLVFMYSVAWLGCVNDASNMSSSETPIVEDTIWLDSEIEIEPRHLLYTEIESLYLEYAGKISDIPDIDSVLYHLGQYFEEMEKGGHPFEVFEDPSFDSLKVDTFRLRLFMENLNDQFKTQK